MFADYRVHHSGADSILVQLRSHGGFGRLTTATLGGDALAERLLKAFAAREHVTAVPLGGTDKQGYRLLGATLEAAWGELWAYPVPVRRLLGALFRKHLLVGLGAATTVRVVRSTGKGTVFAMAPNLTAVAPLEAAAAAAAPETASGDEADALVEVRVLNYDASFHIVNVTARDDVVQRTPVDTATVAAALGTLRAGCRVQATVLLSATDDGCAVVEVPACTPGGEPCSVLGYYVYNWEGRPEPPAGSVPVVGSALMLTVEYAPPGPLLAEATPFIVLSARTLAGAPAPAARLAMAEHAPAAGVRRGYYAFARGPLGFLPWRNGGRTAAECTAPPAGPEEADEADGARLRKRTREEEVDAYERQMADALPTSPDEYRRLLLARPNSSFLWTQYMAHHVGLQEYEAARQVAEKALSTIGVREEQERLNVWVAYLNLENLHGTTESLSAVFKRALRRQSDEFRLHDRLADIFAASHKHGQLLDLCRSMTSKFRRERRAWERLGCVLAAQDRREPLKRMLKDMSQALNKDEAALAVVHIAVQEFRRAGGAEGGRALFEGLLAKHPRKSDVWSAYIDQELALLARGEKEAAVAQVRHLFERAVATNFSASVMQQFLTRFLAFEKAHGTANDVERVKERAKAYVQSRISAATAEVTAAAASTAAAAAPSP